MGRPEDRENGAAPYPAWSNDSASVLEHFGTDAAAGLPAERVEEIRKVYGYNELDKEPGKPLWKLVLEQFDDVLVKVLLLAACVSFVLAFFEGDGEGIRAFIEPLVILLILVLNAVVGVWQESNAENALEALKDMQPAFAKVVRSGKLIPELPTRELVPGDIVHMAVGDKVPADLRIIHINTATLRSEQASLTGESVAVMKTEDAVATADCEIQSKDCMLFSGTAIANGSCVAVVSSIGMNTEMGKIQADITAAGDEDSDTPLKRKLNAFGELLAQVIFYICVVVWAINYSHFLSWSCFPGTYLPDPATVQFSFAKCTYYFKIAVALAVAAIPEGLPAVITTCLALGTRKMAKQNAIIRRLPSVETLGCTTVICSDKTGTLTTNQMSAVQLVVLSSESSVRTYDVKGFTYNPNEGGVIDLVSVDAALDAIASAFLPAVPPSHNMLLMRLKNPDVCAVCNESCIEVVKGAYKCVGAPTEAALVVLAEKLGLPDHRSTLQLQDQRKADPENHPMPVTARRRDDTPSLALLEFDRRRKSMSVIVPSAKGTKLLVKGAAECVLDRCSKVMLPDGRVVALTPATRALVERSINEMADAALRTLALAVRDLAGTSLATYDGKHTHPAHAELAELSSYEKIESELVFLGLVGLQDPPRPEVRQAITDCSIAGIKVIVITGDNKATAESICRKIGVFDDDEDVTGVSMIGRDFVSLPHAQQLATLSCGRSCCFSRAEPRHKQDIVRLLKEMGEIVAMTGDGVNDAPALKLADIGVAMGIAGTEVAKEASDMVLADDNFSTIVAAVREGRSIFDNMKAFIRYMISSNIGEVASIFFTAALGMPEGMIPVQLLWVNLVTDGPPATALGFNPPDKDVMLRHPRDPKEPLITAWVFVRYMVVGIYVGFATVGIFAAWYLFPSLGGIPITDDGHTNITWYQLSHFSHCKEWTDFNPARSYSLVDGTSVTFAEPCEYFEEGKIKASTLSLTVLVAIEMLNALNALSEDSSLLTMPPWCNPWLLVAMAVSFGLHFLIMYVPFLAAVFSIVPLTLNEWLLVLLFASPVLIIDEVLKLLGRCFFNRIEASSKAENSHED